MNYQQGQASERAAQQFLASLKQSDPAAYQIVMQSVNNGNAMHGMGDLWDDIKTGISNIGGQAIQYYQDKEAARQAQKIAEEQAKVALIQEEALLRQLQAEQRNAEIQMQIERERLDLLKMAKDIEFSNWQKVGLWVAAGLAGFLIYNRMA